MPKTIVVTGASSGFGAMTVRGLADAGHSVYAGMRDIAGRNATAAAEAAAYAKAQSVDLRPIEMDVARQDAVDAAIGTIVHEQGKLDVVVHNAGHMVLGPLEAFTPEQLVSVYDTNVVSTQRVNRAALPHLRARRVRVVGTPKGQRPFRVHIDPADDGAETVNRVGDLVRREFYLRLGLDDLLAPA